MLTSLDDELAEAAYEEYEDEVRGAVEDNKNILVLMKNIWSVRARGRDQLRALLWLHPHRGGRDPGQRAGGGPPRIQPRPCAAGRHAREGQLLELDYSYLELDRAS